MAGNDPKDPKRKRRNPRDRKEAPEKEAAFSVPPMEDKPEDDDEEEELEIKLQFWKNILAFEQSEWVSPFQVLVRGGVALPPPEELEGPQLTHKVWEVIHGLALLNAYLVHTDHLSDRALYEELWHAALREPAVLRPENSDFAYYIDCIGSGSEEDTALYLSYYADEEERLQWAEAWPDDPLPEPQPLPFGRDRSLPTPERLRMGGSGKA